MEEQNIKLTKLTKCAGCGAKVGAGVLAQLLEGIRVHHDPNLLVGFDKSDDASVYKISDELALVQTVDFFPPIADDPYLFGQIAATNALSDVYAMGGEPKLCLNIMAVPEDMPKEAVHDILRGGYDKVYEAGALITGGHSILDDEPKYGLAVTGFVHPDKMLTNSAARPGDVLVLTKPIGIGVLTSAGKADLLTKETVDFMNRMMTTLNKAARDVMVRYRVHACTDVTGFGLMGHGFEMAQGSDVALHIDVSAIDLIPEALEFARMGVLPAGMYRNRSFAEAGVDVGTTELAVQDLLFDPQTSGGLLMAVDPADADALLAKETVDFMNRMMTTLNKAARDVMVRYRVHACTDVTGFGLMGHGFEMAQGSDVALHIDVSAIDLIPEALEFARMGVLPAGMYRNRSFAEAGVDVGTTELAVQDLLFDPQTSGGLLMAVDPADADALLAELTPVVPSAQRIGTVGEYHGGKRILLR